MCVCVCVCVSCSIVSDSATPWTVAHQVPLSMKFSRQEYWDELPCPSPGDLPNLGTEPRCPPLQADSFTAEPRGELSLSIVLCSVTQSCLILCDPMDFSLPGSSVQGILQARILEWVAMPFSRGSSKPRSRTQVSHITGRVFTIWATREAPLSDSDTQLVLSSPKAYVSAKFSHPVTNDSFSFLQWKEKNRCFAPKFAYLKKQYVPKWRIPGKIWSYRERQSFDLI